MFVSLRIWASMMEEQDKKIELKASRVEMKKRKEDSMILTVDTSNMDEEVKVAHKFFARRSL
jgi:hypothetical protein